MVTPETELWDPQQASKHKQFNFNLTTYLSSSFILARLHSGFTHFLTLNKHNTILLWTILLIIFISQKKIFTCQNNHGKKKKRSAVAEFEFHVFLIFLINNMLRTLGSSIRAGYKSLSLVRCFAEESKPTPSTYFWNISINLAIMLVYAIESIPKKSTLGTTPDGSFLFLLIIMFVFELYCSWISLYWCAYSGRIEC